MHTLYMKKVVQENSVHQGRDYLFREKWRAIICSWWYIVFAACVTGVYAILVSQLIDIAISWCKALSLASIALDGVKSLQTIIEVLCVILVSFCVINVYGIWHVFVDAKRSEKEPKTLGLKILYYDYLGLLILTAVGFFITLPAFTEWMEFGNRFDMLLQIIYIVYAVVLFYCLIITIVLNKMVENLQILGNSCGPVKAWIALCCIEIIVALIAYTIVMKPIAIMDVLNLVSVVILNILLVEYYRAFRNT